MSNKKFIASTITVAAVAAAFVPAASADEIAFTDVSDRYADAVNFLVGNGITEGKSTTSFGTSEKISRVDASVLIANVLGVDKDASFKDSGFTDVPERAKWAVDALAEMGVLNGFDEDTFGSYSFLTRSQAALILANAAELDVNENVTKTKFSDVNERFAPYVDALVKAGIAFGKSDTEFGANDSVQRGEMALFLERAKEHFGFMDLMVMHTNDTHAYLDNAPLRATAVKEIRATNDNTLLLDAGDVFSGDLYFNKYKGEADLAFMNYIGYDAMTFGNHEFDLGSTTDGHKALSEFVANAEFPMVSSNVDFSKDALFAGLQNDRYTFDYDNGEIYNGIIANVNGEAVGIFGLTTEETENISSTGEVEISNYIDAANEAVAAFEAKGVDKIIALTHIGFDDSEKFDNDKLLAAAVEGIDIIVGGHTHAKVDEPFVSEEFAAPTIIVQANEYGKFLGTLDVTFNPWGEITLYAGELLATSKDITPDQGAVDLLAPYKAGVEELKAQQTGAVATAALDGSRLADNEDGSGVRTSETNLGNLMTDGMLAKAKTINSKTTIAIQNGGGIRASIDEGPISVGEVLKVMPFGNALAIMEVTGTELLGALEISVGQAPKENGGFLHVAGMEFKYDSTKAVGERVTEVMVLEGTEYVALDPAKTYTVATNSFTAKGGDGFTMFATAYAEGRVSEPGFVDYENFIEYIKSLDEVNPTVEGRIVDVSKVATTLAN
ncbi:MAG TPA: 5'-nucleotidase C-terminal domain-containing protein [Paenisporosarcina sp.]|nr:5'-nucleotidase C-terminal domain-containing protein [Paenisporosarcina sp.]